MRRKTNIEYLVTGILVAGTLVLGTILSSIKVSADTNDTVVDEVNVTVPVACTMNGVVNTAHTATLMNGTYSATTGSDYENGIGKTTLTTYCNDYNGFSIYAIGYTNNTEGINTLIGQSTGQTINTAVYTSGDTTSSWSMKLTKVTDTSTSYIPNNLTITNNFNNYHSVPTEYTKVAEYHASTGSSATDTILGSKLETTYAAYISQTQVADTYEGKVKYTLVHPASAAAPLGPLRASDCSANSICYAPNASDIIGSMDSISETKISTSETAGVQTGITSGTAELIAPNYSRSNYGFAGWSTDFIATNSSTIYGPNETITTGDLSANGMILYPVWVASAGTMQNASSVCSNLTAATYDSTNNKMNATLASVSALTDSRDGNTYAIAKLIDGNCWMIENLRLDNSVTATTIASDSQGIGGNFTKLPANVNATWGSDTSNDVYGADTTTYPNADGNTYTKYTLPQLNTNNTNRNLTTSYNGTGNTIYYQWYAYGNYYSWAAAMANTTSMYSYSDSDTAGTSLCPTGWRLPYGSSSNNGATSKGFFYLHTLTTINAATQSSKASKVWRSFPNNLVYSGFFYGSSAYGRGSNGNYWSSTASDSDYSYVLYIRSSSMNVGTSQSYKYYGHSIRCVR